MYLCGSGMQEPQGKQGFKRCAHVFHSIGAAITQLHIPMHLLVLDEDTESDLPCVRLLHSMREETCGN